MTRPHSISPFSRSAGMLVALLLLSAPLQAQTPPAGGTRASAPASSDTGLATRKTGAPSPRGAFLRSLLVPGWGQASFGAYGRGAAFFAAQSGSWFLLLKTVAKLGEAQELEQRRRAAARDSLLADAVGDSAKTERRSQEEALAAEIDSAASVQEIARLVRARKQQREDWIAWTVFWTLAAAVDAFVNAHLADFPADVIAEPRGRGGVSLGIRIPAGVGP
ncbi:MAG: hypothetical protein HY703_02110 [Gemmatimonadetes bacterium]|nr:hypothetical protein [Gemmatimonadota bacterium]